MHLHLTLIYLTAEKENSSGLHLEREIMYATWFLENLAYLKDLKIQFDDRIYLPLTQLFNGESAILQRQLSSLSSDSWSVLLYKDEMPEIADLYKNSELENVITRLRYLKNRLDYLLDDEGEIDPALFSVTSAQVVDGLTLPNNAFIRLMPDIQQKMTTAAILAERWLEIILTKDRDGSTMVSKLERVKTMLGDRLATLNNEIVRETDELTSESDELQDILAREDRSTIISNLVHSLEAKVNKINEKIFQNANQINDIKDLLRTAAGNEQFKSNLMSDLKKKEKLHRELERAAKILQFEQTLTTEDLCIELEMKPSLIRISGSVQDKCEQLESSLEAKKNERYQLEMVLKPSFKDYP